MEQMSIFENQIERPLAERLRPEEPRGIRRPVSPSGEGKDFEETHRGR